MNRMSKMVFWMLVLAALLLASGCNLKASASPTPKPSPTSEMNFITPTADSVKADIMTQTAQAEQQTGIATATATPAADATLAPDATQAPGSTEAPAATKAPGATKAPSATKIPDATKAPSSGGSPVSIPTLQRPATYTIQKGEHPYCIARRFDLNIGDLLTLNGLNSNSLVGAGAVLKIPTSGKWDGASGSRALHAHAAYKVNAGDTVYSIACYFGDVSPEGILAANGLKNASDVKSGMTLKIP